MREKTHFYIYFQFFYTNQQFPLSIIGSFREWRNQYTSMPKKKTHRTTRKSNIRNKEN